MRQATAVGCVTVFVCSCTPLDGRLDAAQLDVAAEISYQRGTCGNGVIEEDEQCERNDPDNCDTECRFPERVAFSTEGAGQWRRPSVTGRSTRPFFVAAHTVGDSRDDVWIRTLSLSGTAITSPAAFGLAHVLDVTAATEQRNARLAMSNAGFIAGVWETAEYTPAYDINSVALSDPQNFLPIAMDFRIGDTGSTVHPNRTNPSIAVSGNFVAIAYENGTSGISFWSGTTPIAAPFSAIDLPLRGEGSAAPKGPVLTAVPDGFVLAWQSEDTRDIHACRLSLTGAILGTQITVNEMRSGTQDQVAVASEGTNVVFAWRDDSATDLSDMSGSTVRIRRFNNQLGSPSSELGVVTTSSGDQVSPAIALGSSHVLVVWSHSDGDIRGRVVDLPAWRTARSRFENSISDFSLTRSPISMPLGIGPRLAPSVAFGGDARFLIAWEDRGTRGVHYRMVAQ